MISMTSAAGQVVNYLSFAGQMPPVAAILLCPCSAKADEGSALTDGCNCVPMKLYHEFEIGNFI